MDNEKIMQALQNGIRDIIVIEDSKQTSTYTVPVSLSYLINKQNLELSHDHAEIFKHCHAVAEFLSKTIHACSIWFEETGSARLRHPTDRPIFMIRREERNVTYSE